MENAISSEDVVRLGQDLQAFKWYFTGCCTLLFYDYALTWFDEVEYAWNGKKGAVFYLFLMNRYCPICFFILTMFAYFSPLWTFEICNRFAIVEWLQTLLIVVPAEMVLLLRMHALTNRNKPLAVILTLIIISQCVIVFYAMAQPGENKAMPVPQIPVDPFHICILFSRPAMDTAYLSMSIVFDSIVFGLTLALTVNGRKIRPKTVLLQTIQRDGASYFCIILSGNIVWMLLALYARPGLKFMNAQPSMLLTSVMINRLTLSLRKASYQKDRRWGLHTFEWPTDFFDGLRTHTQHEMAIIDE